MFNSSCTIHQALGSYISMRRSAHCWYTWPLLNGKWWEMDGHGNFLLRHWLPQFGVHTRETAWPGALFQRSPEQKKTSHIHLMRTLTRNHVVDSVDYVQSKKTAQAFVSVSALSEPVPSVWCFMATMPHFRQYARHLAQDCNGREICSGPPQWSPSNLTGCIHWAIKASQFFRGFKFLDFKWFQSIIYIYIDSSWFINQSHGCLRGILSHKTSKHMAYIFIMLTVGVIIINVQSFRWTIC